MAQIPGPSPGRSRGNAKTTCRSEHVSIIFLVPDGSARPRRTLGAPRRRFPCRRSARMVAGNVSPAQLAPRTGRGLLTIGILRVVFSFSAARTAQKGHGYLETIPEHPPLQSFPPRATSRLGRIDMQVMLQRSGGFSVFGPPIRFTKTFHAGFFHERERIRPTFSMELWCLRAAPSPPDAAAEGDAWPPSAASSSQHEANGCPASHRATTPDSAEKPETRAGGHEGHGKGHAGLVPRVGYGGTGWRDRAVCGAP